MRERRVVWRVVREECWAVRDELDCAVVWEEVDCAVVWEGLDCAEVWEEVAGFDFGRRDSRS